MSKEMRLLIESFKKIHLIETFQNFTIVEFKPKYSVKNYKGYELLLNGEKIAYMVGLKNNNDFLLHGIQVENNYRGSNFGEKLIIEYLKKYGGQIISNSKSKRSLHAEKMWDRLYDRDDVNIRVERAPYPFSPYYLNHYWISLK